MSDSCFSVRTHNGAITVHNPATGNYRMFRVQTQPDYAQFAPGKRVVSVKDSSTDEYWRKFGFVSDDGVVKVWKQYRGTVYEVYARMLTDPAPFVEKGAEYLWQAARCRVCNKELSTPESLVTGIGPVCAKRKQKRQPMSHGRQVRLAMAG